MISCSHWGMFEVPRRDDWLRMWNMPYPVVYAASNTPPDPKQSQAAAQKFY